MLYLIDGSFRKSLRTKTQSVAQFQVNQYIRNKAGMLPCPTVKEFYDRWIETKVEPLVRRSRIRDYKQTFNRYILPVLGAMGLDRIGNKDLSELQVSLMRKGLAVKTCRNIIGGGFRVMYRQARADLDCLNKYGDTLDSNQWVKDYWARSLKALGIRYRKFYCARHTFITEAVKRGWLLSKIAQYCGTSVAMIETNYCGTLTLDDRTVFEPLVDNYQINLASPTGFEPVLSA
ncbi:MAG: hypothetical protein ACREQ2_17290 [Candidatus Binatia bacterium]